MKKIKVSKGLHKEAHSSNSKIASGDYYGTAIKNKTGRMIDSYPIEGQVSSKKIGKPPKSLA